MPAKKLSGMGMRPSSALKPLNTAAPPRRGERYAGAVVVIAAH